MHPDTLQLTEKTMLIVFASCLVFSLLGITTLGLPEERRTFNGKTLASTTSTYFGWGTLGVIMATMWSLLLTVTREQDQILNNASFNGIMQFAFCLAAIMCFFQWTRLRSAYRKERRHDAT